MPNYSFVINSQFKPFSFQEQLVPFEYYKDAYDKADEQYNELKDKSDAFKYLSKTLPEDSKARQIYEGYANGLREQAEDFAQNGLSMANRRALSSYRKRYAGEIGRLSKADEALQKEIDRRTTLNANDPTTLYATDNLSIDDFLDRKRPNEYSVSGDKLYQRGVQIGASDSARIWTNPKVQQINKYYQNISTANGRTPELLNAWRRDLESIPELNDSLNSTLKEFGVTDNLTGINYERAKESVINGIINGSTYKRADNIQRDLSVMSATEAAQDARQREQNQISRDNLNLSAASNGFVKDSSGHWVYSPDRDPEVQKIKAMTGNSETPNGFYQDPQTGKYKPVPKGYKPDASSPTGLVKDESNTGDSKVETYNNKLMSLTSDNLAHNSGFDVQANGDRYHYDYVGAIAAQNGGFVSGAIGDDVPGRGLGFTSSSNVMSKLGNFSAEDADSHGKKGMRVLSATEMQSLLASNKSLYNEVNKVVTNAKIDPNSADIQIIEVPNEKGNSRKGYLIAVHK